MALYNLKNEVLSLRRLGYTFLEINSKLNTSIPKSTLSGWCRDIQLTNNQLTRIKELNKSKLTRNRQKALQVLKDKRLNNLTNIRTRHSHLVEKLNIDNDSALIALSLLNLTEGGKQSGSLMFGNSDPLIIKLFLKLLRTCYEIDESKFRCTIQCRADQNISELEYFWSEVTNIPLEKFYKAQIDARSLGKRTTKPNYKGVCRLDYFSANIYNELQIIAQIVGS